MEYSGKDEYSSLKEARAELGSAISSWALVEDAMCTTFCIALTVRYDRPAILAFYAIRSLEGRLKALNEAIGGIDDLPDDMKLKWQKIHGKIRKKNSKRNELAHCSILSLPHHDHESRIFPFFSMNEEFSRTTSSGRQYKVEEEYPNLRIKEVHERGKSFVELAKLIHLFNEELQNITKMISSFNLDTARRF